MTLPYGYAKGKIVTTPQLKPTQRPHEVQYHLHFGLSVAGAQWDIAVNVGTTDADDLLKYKLPFDFSHPVLAMLQSAAPGSHWHPERARYGVGSAKNSPVTMRDGTVLRADVYYPTAANGKRAAGRFPVVLTLTPYGKNVAGAAGVSDETGPSTYLVKRGYIDVVADVRGTGDSGGQFGLFDPKQDTDGRTLVDWAARRAGKMLASTAINTAPNATQATVNGSTCVGIVGK